MSSTPVVFSDQDIDQSGQSSKPITFGEDEIAKPSSGTALGDNPLGPGSAGYKAPAAARPQPRFTDVWYPRVSTEAQAGAARASSPRATASKAAGMPLADVAGKPQEPQGEERIQGQTGTVYHESAVPEADAVPVLDSWKGVEPIATGLSRYKENDKPVFSVDPNNRFGPPVRTVSEADAEKQRRQRVLGASEVLQGSGDLMTPIAVGTGLANPLPVIAGYGAGYGASEGIGAGVHGHVSPEDEQLIRAASYFIPSALGVATGLKTGTVETPQGKFSAASIFGGKAGAGVRTTPEGTFARVKVGGTTIEVPISRNGGAPAPEGAPAAAPAAPLPAGVTSMVKANAAEAMAKNVVAGRPAVPPPPAPPPTPGEQFGNKLSGDQVDHLAKTIADQPEAKRNGLIEEAHQNLTQWVADNKGKVIIDGKVHIAKTPDQAETLAAKLVNDAVAAHDKQQSALSSQQSAKPEPEAASPVKQFLASSRPASTTETRRPGEETGKSAKTVQNAQNVQIPPISQAAPVQELQAPTPKPVQASLGNEAAVVPPEPQTTQNLTANEGAKTLQNEPGSTENLNRSTVSVPQQFADQDIQPERRTNVAERKRVAEMSPEEMARELHTSRLDNGDGTHTEMPIPNGRAFHDAPASPAVAMSDSDGLKAFNDKFGYKAGNAILVAKGEAAKEAGLDAYHQKGDEFLYHGESPEHLKAGLEKAREILRNREFTVTDATGKQVTLKGVDFSYGTGTDLATAESGLKAHKQQREDSGERARGELRGITEVGHETAAEGGSQAASEVTPQTFHESDIEHELPEGVPAKGKSGEVPTGLLHFDPKRFQYKLNVNEKGVTNLLHGQKFNQDLAGVVSVWHDPEDGKLYVVNGHHRAQLAKETRQKELLVRHLDVAMAGEARAVGALQNIAEGRGTAIDAAKFFRDRGISPEDLNKHGISLGEAKAADGLALSKLDQSLFERVATGKMSEGRGVAIGQATTDPAQQEAIVKLLDKREKQGKNITDAMVAELARFVGSSGNKTIEQGGLFGANQQIHSLALEKAEISAHIKGQIAKERRVFGSVATEDKAAALGQVKGQKLKAEQNKRIADAAGQAEEAYNKLSSHAGPVNDILEKSAKELASGYHKPEDIKARAYRDVRDEIRKTVTGSEGQSAGRSKKDSGPGKGNEESPAFSLDNSQGQPLFNLSKDELRDWAVAAGRRLKVEEMGDQGRLFGGGEKMYRLSTSKQNSVAVTQSQLDQLTEDVPRIGRMLGMEPPKRDGVWVEYNPPEASTLFTAAKPPELTISRQARDLINKAGGFKERFNGANLSPQQANGIANALIDSERSSYFDELQNMSRSAQAERTTRHGQIYRLTDALKQAADDAGNSGVTVLVEGSPEHVASEESFHAAQRGLGEGQIRDHLSDEAVDGLLDHPAAKAMEASLKAMGYDDNLHPAFKIAEIAAKIATGQAEDTSDAADWFVKYVDALHQQHGEANVASAFSNLYDGARELYERAKAAETGAAEHPASGREAGIQSPAEGLPERATGPPEAIRGRGNRQDQNRAAIQGTLDQPFLLSRDAGDKIPAVPADKGAGSKPSATPKSQQAERPSTFEEFTKNTIKQPVSNAKDLTPVYFKSAKAAKPEPFMDGRFELRRGRNENGDGYYTVLNGGKPIASMGPGALAVDKEYRKIGIAKNLVRQYILDNPGYRPESLTPVSRKIFEDAFYSAKSKAPKSDTTSRPQSGGISLPKKGDTVTLADGREGTVQYVHPEMNIARVKTGDGKTVTVGLKSLKDRSGEAGFAKLDIPSAVADLVKAAHEKVFAPTENRIARGVDDTLYQLGKQYDADVLRTIKLLKSVGPTTSPEDQEAIYHHKEDSSVQLNQRQQDTLDNIVQPLMETNSEMRAKLNKAGIPMGEDDGYIHRVVQGKNNPLERAMRGKGGTGKGNVLSKAASSLKGRRMFAAEDEDGKRVVIHRNGDTMTAFDNGSASEFAKDKPGLQVGDEFNSKDGQRWTLKQATTKEIEEHTGVRYYKSALANTVVDYLQLRRAERANDALEGMKGDPEFKSLSFKPEHGEMPPDGWRTVNLPQFNGYYFEPHMAETLDRFADELRADPAGAMEKIGNLMTASLVLNPARHVYNIGNHWLVERGVTGNFNPLIWPRSAKAGIRAIKAVMTQNDDFVNALDHGAPMMSHRQDLRELHQHLVDSMLGFLQQHTDVAAKIAELGGHLNHVDMLKGLYKLGQKMTWMSNDMFFLQSIYEKELGGMKFDDAAAETAKHIPDYRIPSRVLNSPGLSKFMNSHLLTVFSRYHYGVWKSYGQMLKEVAGPESSLKDRGKGLDHMLMLGLLTFVGYELWDKLLKHATGDPKARMVRSGASAVPYLVNEIAQGNKPPEELIQGTFTPAVLPKTAAELAFNRDLYSGGRIYDRHDPAATIAHDVGKKTLGALGPSQQAEKAERSDTPMRDFLAYQGGVTFPNTEVQSPAVRLMHEILRENMTLTPELQRQLDDKRARIQSGNLTQKERKTQLKEQALDELSYYLPHVARYSDVKKVFNAATPEEKEIIRPIMLKKAVNVMRNNPIEGEREGALQAFEER